MDEKDNAIPMPKPEGVEDTQVFTGPPAAEPLSEEEQAVAEDNVSKSETRIYRAGDRVGEGDPSRKKPPPKPPKPPKTKEQLEWEQANRKRFKEFVWGPWLHPVIALVAICLVTSLLLGLTNELTADRIAANERAEADAAMQALLPEADAFNALPADGSVEGVDALYQAQNGAGWVVESWGRGYGGKVPALVAFDPDGNIAGVTYLANSETPGLGQKLVTDPSFSAQFAGLAGESVAISDVDKIASATISTGAAVNAVNAAIEAYKVQVLGEDGSAIPIVDVPSYLLPGETLTPITIDAPNAQAAAYRSDAGNYIIFGEKPPEGEYGSLVIAAVAMDSDGVILNLWLDTSGESEQYGATLATNRSFIQSFIGESAPVQVDVVADVTNSSNSVMLAVNNALAALPLAKEAA